MTTFSKPPATPGTPVGPKPSGPTHPVPTCPPPRAGRLAPRLPLDLVAAMVEAHLSRALALVDGDLDPASFPADRTIASMRLSSVAFHLDRALVELAHLSPAHRDPMDSRSQGSTAVATPGEPVKPPAATGEELPPGSADALCGASSESPGAVWGAGAGVIQPHWHDLIDFRLPRDIRSGS